MTVEERAAELGIAPDEYLSLARREPWITSWGATWSGGAENLAAWLAAGRPWPDRAALVYAGHAGIGAAVRGVLEKLPDAVAHFLVGNAVVYGIRAGWVGVCIPPLPTPPRPEAQLILLQTDTPAELAHEFGHAWHRGQVEYLRYSEAQAAVRAFYEERSIEIAVEAGEKGRIEDLVREILKPERAADEFAHAMGWPDLDTVTHRIPRVRAEILRRAATTTPESKTDEETRHEDAEDQD